MASRHIKWHGFIIFACLAYSASIESSPISSKDMSTAKCRAFCLNTNAKLLESNQSESCSSVQSCSTCWQTCALLFHETSIWSPMCNTRICNGGCNIACEYWLLHKNKAAIANLSIAYTLDRKPVCLVNAKSTFVYWLTPTAIDGSHYNSSIVYAIFIKETSHKNMTLTQQWKQVKQTSSVSTILPFRILPTRLIRLVAITEKGILANIYFQSKLISFPEFSYHSNIMDNGLLQNNELWTTPRSQVSTIIREIPNGRVQVSLLWNGSAEPNSSRSVYKVLWRMLSCDVYRNIDPCHLHAHYNVTLIHAAQKGHLVHLKINLRFNSEYVIQIEKILVGVDTEQEVKSSNPDATLMIVHTPRCVHPDSSYFTCIPRLGRRNTIKTVSRAETALDWLYFVAVILGFVSVFILLFVMAAVCWDKSMSNFIQKRQIPSLKSYIYSPLFLGRARVSHIYILPAPMFSSQHSQVVSYRRDFYFSSKTANYRQAPL